MKKLYYLFMALTLSLVAFTGCNSEAKDQNLDDSVPIPQQGLENVKEGYTLPQFQEPKEEDTIAILHTSFGDIQLVLYPEAAPLAVENFIGLSETGYYDGSTFHRVINEFMIQTGDPTGNGGQSIWEEPFKEEFHPLYHHFRGALAMARPQLENSNGSQFYIVQANASVPEYIEVMKKLAIEHKDGDFYNRSTDSMDAINDAFSEEVIRAYEEFGGVAYLDYAFIPDYQHTVFGQVIRGMDVVDAIAAVETANEKPIEDIIIESIEICTYKELKAK